MKEVTLFGCVLGCSLMFAATVEADSNVGSKRVVNPGNIIDGADEDLAALGKKNGDGILVACSSWSCPLGSTSDGNRCSIGGWYFNGWVIVSISNNDCSSYD